MCGKKPCNKPSCTWSEAHRAECEARYVARMGNPDEGRAMKYLLKVEKVRGAKAVDKLRTMARDMWRKL